MSRMEPMVVLTMVSEISGLNRTIGGKFDGTMGKKPKDLFLTGAAPTITLDSGGEIVYTYFFYRQCRNC